MSSIDSATFFKRKKKHMYEIVPHLTGHLDEEPETGLGVALFS